MNPEVKKLWVDALESGEYAQTRSFLRGNDGFCCLGVLCDIYAKTTGIGKWIETPLSKSKHLSFLGDGFKAETSLPPDVSDWADFTGLKSYEYDGITTDLATFNDGSNAREVPSLTFSEIAKIIRKYE